MNVFKNGLWIRPRNLSSLEVADILVKFPLSRHLKALA